MSEAINRKGLGDGQGKFISILIKKLLKIYVLNQKLDGDEDFQLDESPKNDNEIDHEFDETLIQSRNHVNMNGEQPLSRLLMGKDKKFKKLVQTKF